MQKDNVLPLPISEPENYMITIMAKEKNNPWHLGYQHSDMKTLNVRSPENRGKN